MKNAFSSGPGSPSPATTARLSRKILLADALEGTSEEERAGTEFQNRKCVKFTAEETESAEFLNDFRRLCDLGFSRRRGAG